jgi:type I restriction enzyme R subunit
VACSRHAAIQYKKTLDELKAPSSEVLISKSNNDEKDLAAFHKSKTEEQEIIRRFKEEADPKILIVCDKLLTGFDAPVDQVMYLDSPLKEHTLLQAVARVNRTLQGKQYGLVVDYWGVSQDLQEALRMFTVEESEGLINMDYKKEVLPRLQSAHNAAMNFFREVGVNNIDACVRYLEPEDRRVAFDQRFKLLSNYMDMLFPDPAALPFVKDLRHLAEIRARARNVYRDPQLSLNECSEKVRKLIEEHIRADSVIRVIEPTSIFSKKFDEEIKRLGSDEARATVVEHAIKQEINIKLHEDPVFYESLKERLERILFEFKDGRINAAKQLVLLEEVLDDVRHPENSAKEMGVEQNVAPFYNLIKSSGGQEDPKDLATSIYNALDELAVVEWSYKEDIKREMRRNIKRILRAGGCPDEKLDFLSIQILDLAKARFVR